MIEWLVFEPESGLLTALQLPLWAAALAVLVPLAAACVIAALLARRAARRAAGRVPAPCGPGPVAGYEVGKLHCQGAREGQQDSFGVSDGALLPSHGLLAVVADGMGGLSNGEQVSAAAVQAALDAFARHPAGESGEETLLALAERAVQTVNELLGPEGLRKSGSTLVLALLREQKLWFLSVGDSRVCLFRQGALLQLNREHTYRRELALRAVNGETTLAAALSDEKGGALTSFVGMGRLKAMDLPAAPLELWPGDRVVLMSDGVYNALSDEELAAALKGGPEEAARALGEAVEAKGFSDQDNYTAVILGCRGEN